MHRDYDYNDDLEGLEKRYGERALRLLKQVADELEEEGYVVDEPSLIGSDDGTVSWGFMVHVDGDTESVEEDDVDVQLRAMCSEPYDGTEHGVNFGIDVTQVSGRMIGGLTPFNYSDKVWVDRGDQDAVDERFDLLMRADLSGIASSLQSHGIEPLEDEEEDDEDEDEEGED